MAATFKNSVQYWYNFMIAQKQSLPALAGGTPTYNPNDNPYLDLLNAIYTSGPVGRWQLQCYIVAVVAYTFYAILQTFQSLINTQLADNQYGDIPWYVQMGLYFQYNYILQQQPNTYNFYYADTTSAAAIAARVVTQCAADEESSPGTVIIKIAGGTPGNNAPLASNYATAFAAYIDQIQPPGININIVNANPDVVKAVGLTVFFDGTLDEPAFIAAVQLAITNGLSTVQTPFNGKLFLNGYIDPATGNAVLGFNDFIRAVPGCKGVEFGAANGDGLWAKPAAGGGYPQVLFDYNPESGYLTFDLADSPITYTAA